MSSHFIANWVFSVKIWVRFLGFFLKQRKTSFRHVEAVLDVYMWTVETHQNLSEIWVFSVKTIRRFKLVVFPVRRDEGHKQPHVCSYWPVFCHADRLYRPNDPHYVCLTALKPAGCFHACLHTVFALHLFIFLCAHCMHVYMLHRCIQYSEHLCCRVKPQHMCCVSVCQ